MHPAGEKRGRSKNKYTAEALETIKQDLTRFQVQKKDHEQGQVNSFLIYLNTNFCPRLCLRSNQIYCLFIKNIRSFKVINKKLENIFFLKKFQPNCIRRLSTGLKT